MRNLTCRQSLRNFPAATLGIKLTWTGAAEEPEAAASVAAAAAGAAAAGAGASSVLGVVLIYQNHL